MGYYSTYKLNVASESGEEVDNKALAEYLTAISGYSFDSNLGIRDVKWYLHQEHIKSLTLKFGVTVHLYRRGEEEDDKYIYVYKAGQITSQRRMNTLYM